MLPDDPIDEPPIPETRRLQLDGLWSESWQLMKKNYMLLVVVSLILTASAALPPILNLWIPYVEHIVAAFLYWPILAGTLMLGVRLSRGPRPILGDMFAGFSRYWPLVGIGLIVQVINFLILGFPLLLRQPALIGSATLPMILLSCGLFVVVVPLVILLGVRFWLAPVLCLDEHAGKPGVFLSLVAAWGISGPNFWIMLVAQLLMGLIVVGSLLLLGVGVVLLGFPMYICAFGVVYTRLMGPLPVGVCPECGYDTSASPTPLCPECGTPTGVPLPPPILGAG